MAYNVEKMAKVGALKKLAEKLKSDYPKKEDIPTKVSDLTNDSKFQSDEQVTAAINAKLSSTYKAGGSVAFAALPELTEANLGLVVNITDSFTTTADFIEGEGVKHPAGVNMVVVQSGESYMYDVLSGFVDLSGYATKEELEASAPEVATDAEVDEMLADVFGAPQG